MDLDLFDIDNTKNLWAYAIRIGSNIVYFRKYTENKILEKKGLLSLFVEDGVFNKLTKSILTIDQNIDCIYFQEKIYILNKNQFELIFSFMDKFIDEIDNTIDNLTQKSLVDNTSFLYEICKPDPKKIKKLNRVLKSDVLPSLTFHKIKHLNDQYNLDIEFTDDNKIKINRKNIWTILKVLDDDYLKSPMTENKYEVHSKVRRS